MCAAPSGGRDGASRGAPRESCGAAAGRHRSRQRTKAAPPHGPAAAASPRSAVEARGSYRAPLAPAVPLDSEQVPAAETQAHPRRWREGWSICPCKAPSRLDAKREHAVWLHSSPA